VLLYTHTASGAVLITESIAPVVMPASRTKVASVRMWEPYIKVIRLWCICPWRIVFAMQHFSSQTELPPDTGTVQSTSPLNNINDTFKVLSMVMLSPRYGRGYGVNMSSVSSSDAMSSAEMWLVHIPWPLYTMGDTWHKVFKQRTRGDVGHCGHQQWHTRMWWREVYTCL
jgi:hypothetical protein